MGVAEEVFIVDEKKGTTRGIWKIPDQATKGEGVGKSKKERREERGLRPREEQRDT